ncbi:helix-turn-helix domain-containing protein [Bradyrhizobium sp. AUGA SZCCT0160]|uniref:helix-turn-helix domain-containing protein n=1 Tax=Bradyrhizobium sp. AUGA SZCCT0160 TaxID=2807662 RepID=UPI001BA50773|nr:helix-turn-helix transcriptional regulator [Bradyrhizobium sp. AUGA SZCCT0160]MBR1188551.1 helix-turn-helix transcriptional regulator [Bradyrhizobium sp. AUGA SZCCT0160]
MGRNEKKQPPSFLRYRKVLGDNVLRLREEAGLSQAELAEKADLKRQALLSDIERSRETVNPTLETLCRLAAALKVDVITLLSRPDKS